MYNTLFFKNIFSKDSGRWCLSCSGIENLTDCTVIEACKDDEVCALSRILFLAWRPIHK